MSGPGRPSIRTSAERESRPGISRQSSGSPDVNYACPFTKHDPITYSHCNSDAEAQEFRSCSTGLMRNISRLKQHLSRTHKDAMTEEQQRLVMERVSGDHAQGWYNIFHILFPDDPLPPTPYAEYVTGEHLRRMFTHMLKNLPKLLFDAACEAELSSGSTVKLTPKTRFPTSPERIIQALAACQRDFGVNQGINHVFARGSPNIDLSTPIRATSRARQRPNQDSHMTQSMGTFSAGGSPDEEMSSGTSCSDEFDEQLALRTIQDYNIHSLQGKSNGYSPPMSTPIYPPYTVFNVSPRMAFDASHVFGGQRYSDPRHSRRPSGQR